MILKKLKKGNIMEYIVDKDYSDDKLEKILNKKLKKGKIKIIIDHDSDVYTKEGVLLLKFRKNKLKQQNVDDFYENTIQFAKRTSGNRGSASGSKKNNIYEGERVMSNILGYFDNLSPSQKILLKNKGTKILTTARETRFNMDYPDNFKKIIPLIKEIDKYYEEYIPDKYEKQRKKADQTPFKIVGTSFTTITTNVNFQTTVHTDKGDDPDGFGNLSVCENGKYTGGETCFPQYGIGVDVRSGDVLYMDVHQPHGNLPIKLESLDAIRLSIVCYLRTRVWEKTKGKTKKFMISHNKTIKNLRKNE